MNIVVTKSERKRWTYKTEGEAPNRLWSIYNPNGEGWRTPARMHGG